MKRVLLAVLGLLLVSVGCSSPLSPGGRQKTGAEADPAIVDPVVQVTGSSEGIVIFDMGASNMSNKRIKEQETFEGRWQLLNEVGEIRAEGHMYHFGPLGPEEAHLPLRWEGELDEGSYRLLWGAPTFGSSVTRFEVEVDGDVVNVHWVRADFSNSFPPAGGFVE